MADEDVVLRIKLEDQERAQAGLKDTADDVEGVGRSADRASRSFGGLERSTAKGSRAFSSIRASSRGVSGSVGLVTSGIGRMAGAVGGVLAVGAGFRTAFGEASESAKVGAQTNAVLKSTGAVAGVTATEVGNLATKISNYAGIDDEAIQSAENLLLTFTNVRNEAGRGNKIFDQTTIAATNMGVALGTDTTSAAMMLGKALNDPAKGFSRLQRSGVSFTAGQVKQIKTLQSNNDLLGAQKIILGEVNKEFGGSAAAQAQPMEKVKVALGNVAEAVGTALLPAINKVATPLAHFLNGITQGTGAGGRFARTVKSVAIVIGDVTKAISSAITGKPLFEDELNSRHVDTILKVKAGVEAVVGVIRTAVPQAVAFGKSVFDSFSKAVGPIRPVATAILLVGQRVLQVTGYIFRQLAPAFRSIAAVVGGAVRLIAQLIHGDFAGAWGSAKQIVVDAKNAIVNTFRGLTAPIRTVISKIPDALGDIGKAFLSIGKKIIQGIIDGIVAAPNAILNAITGLPGVSQVAGVLGLKDDKLPDHFQGVVKQVNKSAGTTLADPKTGRQTSAASRAPRAILPSISPGFAGMAAAGAGASGGWAPHITVQSVLDGQVVATSTARADANWDERR